MAPAGVLSVVFGVPSVLKVRSSSRLNRLRTRCREDSNGLSCRLPTLSLTPSGTNGANALVVGYGLERYIGRRGISPVRLTGEMPGAVGCGTGVLVWPTQSWRLGLPMLATQPIGSTSTG